MATVADIPVVGARHLDRIKSKLIKAELLRNVAVVMGCETEMITAVGQQIDDIKLEHEFYREEYNQ